MVLSSVAASRAFAAEPYGAYAASKAGVLALVRQMAVECGLRQSASTLYRRA